MVKKILLNNQVFHFTKSDLPILIHGEDGSGASLFTICALADLYFQGSKVIALTGFPMAQKEFEKQIGSNENVQFFTKEKIDEFIDLVSKTSDIIDDIVLMKNIELFNEEIFNTIKNFNNLILSGDINKCSFKDKLLQKHVNTKIYFSQLDEQLPEFNKYQGFLVSENLRGVVSL